VAEEMEKFGDGEDSPRQVREQVRYLLGRRLARMIRGNEAREYIPAEWLPQFEALIKELTIGWDESASPDQRAQALFSAAFIARTNGMELLGTEVEPDWHIYGGEFEGGVSASTRTNDTFKFLHASSDELRRAAQHNTDPELRFHYRYQAAFLAWEAAKLLPNNSDETARVLCTAGSWLKGRDPETADIFYKALVKRCRKTAIGEQADRMRWFPILDTAGNPMPYKPRLEMLEPPKPAGNPANQPAQNDESTADPSVDLARDYPMPGKFYFIHSGDSMAAVAHAVSQLGQPTNVRDLLEANPGLDPARLKIGQKIIIPILEPSASQADDSSSE
jgi:hypothetical protein